jgi:hypothetical protein
MKPEPARFEREMILLLVTIQSGIALLTAVGVTVAGASGFRGGFGLAFIQAAWTVLLFVLAVLSLNRRRRAAAWLAALEASLAALSIPALVLGLGVARDLAPVLTNVGLPLAVSILAGRESRPSVELE